MKRLISICAAILLVCAFVADLSAQTVKVKIEAMSPGRRSSGPPNYTAPPGPYYVSTGLRTVAKGMKVYLSADTTGSITSLAWSFVSKPSGSTAVIDTPSNKFVRFIPDLVGQYIVQVQANGSLTAVDTVFASTFVGPTGGSVACVICHGANAAQWAATPHASIFARGITGQLEVEPNGMGAYANGCVKCHTSGWEPTTDNGNFGYLAHQTNWDSTWFIGLPYQGGDYWIRYRDSTIFRNLPSVMRPVANIGCEACHGPGANHMGNRFSISKSLDAGMCLQCHDAPKKHRLGSYWLGSKHAKFEEGGHTSNTSCFPCHSGSAFVKWIGNKTTPGYSVAADGNKNISCAVCHDPHDMGNERQLRTVVPDSLKNGYPIISGAMGQTCMRCHQARYVQKVKSTGPYYGFGSRFTPHHSNQTDMLLGRNSFEFGDPSLAGRNTHAHLENACVTCHMAERVIGSSVLADHEMSMIDTVGGAHDQVEGCIDCHGEIEEFDDIMAAYDYDRDGTVEGLISEVHGMLDVLKSRLPLGTNGEPIGGGTVTAADSARIMNRPDLVQGIWTYYFVTSDGSYGAHNAKYAVALLQKALGTYPTDVKRTDDLIPGDYALNQNYPNPFNPSTTISFSVAKEGNVRVDIYDILGGLVTTIVDKELTPGNYNVTWEGTDRNGQRVASGMYLFRMQSGSFSSVKKMLMLK